MSERAVRQQVDIDLTPRPWRSEPTTLITKLGERVGSVVIIRTPEIVTLPVEVQKLSQKLTDVAESDHNFFNGPLTHVDRLVRVGEDFELHTRDTNFFDYVAAGHYYGELQGTQERNPLRVLATQSVVMTEGGKFMFERKTREATEFPGRYHLFGGSHKPTEESTDICMKNHMRNKWGVELKDEQMQVSGLELDNVNAVVHVFYLNRLSEEQFSIFYGKYWSRNPDDNGVERWKRGRREVLNAPNLTLDNVIRLLKHQPLDNWNPPAFDDLLFGLAASGEIDVEVLKTIRQESLGRLQSNPYTYEYPYQTYASR